MVSYGPRHHKRKLYTKKASQRGIVGKLKNAKTQFEVNQKVVISIDSAEHSGMPHFRYHGYIGYISEKLSNKIYKVNISKGNKVLITNKYHIKSYGF